MFFGNQEIFQKTRKQEATSNCSFEIDKKLFRRLSEAPKLAVFETRTQKMTRTRQVIRLFNPPLLSDHRDHVLDLL